MVEKTFINPTTGKPFAWHEYNAWDDTVLAYGIDEDREEELRAMLTGLKVKLYFTDELTDIYGIPYFFAIINPTKIDQDELAGFFEFWSYDPDLKIMFTEPLPSNLPAPKVKYKVEAESLSDLAKLRLAVLNQIKILESKRRTLEKYSNRVLRILAILKELKTTHFVTTSSLATKLGVTVRTIERDLKIIEQMGEPLGYEPKTRSYFLLTGESFLWDD